MRHATRNNLMTNQTKIMFGSVARDLETFVEQSQTVQAEAMKTFCEMFRSRKFTRFNGLIWWNVRDGWPQISDAVVDWYGGKKPAYYALKAVQHDQLAMLGDDHVAWAVNDRRHPVKGHATYRDKASGKVRFVPSTTAVFKFEQSRNAPEPREDRLEGVEILVRLRHPEKAAPPIDCIPE